MPFRVANVRKISPEYYVNLANHAPNEHLGKFYYDKDLIIADTNFIPITGLFKHSPEIQKNDFYARDYFRENYRKTSYFPRYKNQLYEIEQVADTIIFNQLAEFDIGEYQIKEEDFMQSTDRFLDGLNGTNKLFSFGSHIVTNNWISVEYEKHGKSALQVFHKRQDNITYAGSKIDFDVPNLPAFSFPISANGEECVTLVDRNLVSFFKNITQEQKNYYINKNAWSRDFEELIDKIDDVEEPLLLFYTLKK
ncbi:MAG: hypothetical protein ACJAR3_000377 [Roseivirga sp.]